MKRHKKLFIILFSILSFATLLAAIIFITSHQFSNYGENNVPRFIKANVIDPQFVMSVSKFRSTAGHSNPGWPETCRSMKHYVNTVDPSKKVSQVTMDLRKQTPTPDSSIDIYSPVDGSLSKGNTGEGDDQINISVDGQPGFSIRLEHVHLIPELSSFMQKVKAGQKIATIWNGQNFDLSVYYHYYKGDELFSYFEVLPDDLFKIWQEQGATMRDEFVFTKEYRDAHPGRCDTNRAGTPNFLDPSGKVTENWTPDNFIYLAANKYSQLMDPNNKDTKNN